MGLYLRTIFVELCLDLADSSLLLLLWRTLSQGTAEAGLPATSAYRGAGHRSSQYLALTDATELPLWHQPSHCASFWVPSLWHLDDSTACFLRSINI